MKTARPAAPGSALWEGSHVLALDDGRGDQGARGDLVTRAVVHVYVVPGAAVDRGRVATSAAGDRLANREERLAVVGHQALRAADRGCLHDPFRTVPGERPTGRGSEGEGGGRARGAVGQVRARAGGARAGGAQQRGDHVA